MYCWPSSTVTPLKFSYIGNKHSQFLTGAWSHREQLHKDSEGLYKLRSTVTDLSCPKKKARRQRAYSTVGSPLKGFFILFQREGTFLSAVSGTSLSVSLCKYMVEILHEGRCLDCT